jgi:hypothetical protein
MTAVDASQVAAFAAQLQGAAAVMRLALQAELVRIGTDAKVHVNASHDRPYLTGTLRRSVDLAVAFDDVSLWSSVVYSRIWELGGTVVPDGVTITIPRTEFVGKEVQAAGAGAEYRLGETFESIF